FAAIAFASKSTPATEHYYFALSGWLIFAAMVFDALDGFVARLSKAASDFGGQLDSLCDAISFGAAPAFLLLRMGPGLDDWPRMHRVLAVVATLYMVCTILRLARFNVENTPDPASHRRFRGLPSPAAAGCLAALAVLRSRLLQEWSTANPDVLLGVLNACATVGALLVALLMVSRLPYPHLTNQILRGRKRFGHLIQIILAALLLWMLQEWFDAVLVLLFWGYALGMPVYVAVRGWLRTRLPQPATGIDDVLPH